jgi:hypothetical protein
MFTAALRRLVESACLKLPFYEVAGTVKLTAERVRFSVRGCRSIKEIRKQDQIGILAQNILLCGKLRLEFFRERLFRARRKSLSSGAMVTAAEKVQARCNFLCEVIPKPGAVPLGEGPRAGHLRRSAREPLLPLKGGSAQDGAI